MKVRVCCANCGESPAVSTATAAEYGFSVSPPIETGPCESCGKSVVAVEFRDEG